MPILSLETLTFGEYYLFQLIEQPITNPEFLQRFFWLFTFWVLLPGKSFELRLKYIKNANITVDLQNSYLVKILKK